MSYSDDENEDWVGYDSSRDSQDEDWLDYESSRDDSHDNDGLQDENTNKASNSMSDNMLYGIIFGIVGIFAVPALILVFNNDSGSTGATSPSTPTYIAPAKPRPSPQTYNGYTCSDDCSGHEAGYEWASENGITQDEVDNYDGNSDSFREGMQSYVDEQ